jgi:hypothetical protein
MIKNYKAELNNAYVDCFYEFSGRWEAPSRCGLKIKKGGDVHLVIATELYLENPGTSVTEFCPELATLITGEFKLDPALMCFVVRTPENKSKLSFLNESFARAHMEWNEGRFGRPRWEPLSREQIDAMLKA